MFRKIQLIIFLIIIVCVTQGLFAQTRKNPEFRRNYTAPDEIISLSQTMTFDQVFAVFYDLSKKYLGKIIISEVNLNFPIGIDIDKLHWLDAFEQILRKNGLWYEEQSDYLRIISTKVKEEPKKQKNPDITFHSREVAISAIFFEADGSKLAQLGFSWDFFRGNDVNMQMSMTAAGAVSTENSQTGGDDKPAVLQIQAQPELDFGSLLALFKALESDQVGEVVANPQITVRSGVAGIIQVGSDIAVTTRDFAGNTVNQFFSTGSIINVTPEVIEYDSVNFIHLNLKIERSNTGTSTTGLEIKKSQAQTSILMLDGEESIIGGLYVNEESNTREGVPVLKDLPWWFFGLKYLFGYDSKRLVKKELLIIIKAELVPSLAERLEAKKNLSKDRLLQMKRKENSLKMKYYKEQLKQKN